MSASIAGEILGSPGPAGSPPLGIFFGKGAPSTLTVDPALANTQNAQLGSLYIDYAAPALYFKTAQPNTWTQVAIP